MPSCSMIVEPNTSKQFFEFGYDNQSDRYVLVHFYVHDILTGSKDILANNAIGCARCEMLGERAEKAEAELEELRKQSKPYLQERYDSLCSANANLHLRIHDLESAWQDAELRADKAEAELEKLKKKEAGE